MESLHSLLRRQLKKVYQGRGHFDDSLKELLLLVSDSYCENDKDRDMLERSLDLSSKELIEANSDLRSMFNALPDLLFKLDSTGKIVNYKSGSGTEFKFTQAKIVGEELQNILPLGSPQELKHAIDQVTENRKLINIEICINNSANVIHYEIRLLPLLKKQILVIMRDITRRKQIENKVAQNKLRLETQNQILTDIANNGTIHDGNIKNAFSELVKAAATALNVERVGIWLYSDDHTSMHCAAYYDGKTTHISSESMLNIADYPHYFNALAEGRAIAVHDVHSDSRTSELLEDYLIPLNITSILDAPIRIQGQYAGVICHEHTQSVREWTLDEQQFAASMADLISLIFETHERQKAQHKLLESEERFRILAETTDSAIFAFREKFFYVNPAMENLTGYSAEELLSKGLSIIFNESFIEKIKNLHSEDLTNLDTRIHQEVQIKTKSGSMVWLYLAVGSMHFDGKSTYLASAFDISERKLIEEQLRHQAFHDKLTSLPNRALFIDRLGHSLIRIKRQKNFKCAVLFLDIDRFKIINESLGHAVGDELLIEMSNRLKVFLREIDTIGRIGGDEFVILLEDLENPDIIINIAERIQEELCKPFLLCNQEIYSSVSIGIAIADSRYQDPEHILRDADIAMYRAKAKGKACHEVFDSQMHVKAQKALKLENDLRRAIKNEEFILHYQPIISLDSRRTIGFEALIRWEQEKTNFILPAEFIPIAEETGLIIPLGLWVIETACAQLKRWHADMPELTITINLSSKQFEEKSLINQIQSAMSKNDIDPSLIKLELTESMIMENSESVLKKLAQLKKLGLKLLIDDFGTGYSSLSYLHQFPIDALKIDRSFIANIGSRGQNSEIVNAIISLAHNLNLKVIAEGVETNTHLDQLIKSNCDYVQGYFFSRPVAAAEAGLLLHRNWRPESIDELDIRSSAANDT